MNLEDAHWQPEWLPLLRPFSSVKDLVLLEDMVKLILKELAGERVSDVLPALQNIFLKGSFPSAPPEFVQEAIEKFVVARQLSGRPVILHYWVDRSERGARRVGEWVVLHEGFRTLSDG
jgi:hypothetical protein